MNLLLLAGYSKHNQPWIHGVEDGFKNLFGTTIVHEYKHWETGEDFIDLEAELERVGRSSLAIQPYCIFAKSVGTVLTIKGIHQKMLHPRACLFVVCR